MRKNSCRIWGKRLDELMEDLNAFKDRAKVEYADEIDELKRNKDTIKDEFNEFRDKHSDRIDEIQSRLETAASEIGKAIEATFRKMSKEKGAPESNQENKEG